MSRIRVGVALDDQRMVARAQEGARTVHRIELGGQGVPERDTLAAAFSALRDRLEADTGTPLEGPLELGIALLAPLAQFRTIELPPLSDAETEALLSRDAARYFPGGAARRVVAVHPRSGNVGPVRAVAAPAALLGHLVGAAADAGCHVGAITTGWSAWAAGRGASVRDSVLAIARRGELQALGVEAGEPTALRRAPLDEAGTWMTLVGPDDVTLLGDEPELTRVRQVLEARSVRVRTPSASAGAETGPGASAGAAEFAADHAFAPAVRLMPEALRVERAAHEKRRGVRLFVTAAVLTVLAVALHAIGLQRELRQARAARAEIAADVAPLVAMRDSLALLNDEVAAVREVSRRSHDWTTALSEVAILLPRETWITSLTGAEGELEFEAAGERAGAAIDALRAARSVSGVRLEGLVERELENGETVVERFRLGAAVRLRPAGSAASPASASNGGAP